MIIEISETNLLSLIDMGSFNKTDQIKNALDTIASVCVEWNGTKTYDPVKCNCQHFVTDVLSRLNLWQDKASLNITVWHLIQTNWHMPQIL